MEVGVKVTHPGKMKFQIQARQHVIESDQPSENGGEDMAMTPPELFLASLGSCVGFYVAHFLSRRNLADHGVEISVTAEELREPARMGNIVVKVKSPVPLTEDQRLGVERSAHRCLIHQTLLSAPKIEFEVE